MKIETKFDINETVYLKFYGYVVSAQIVKIIISYFEHKYILNNYPDVDFEEDELFKTKEELLASL